MRPVNHMLVMRRSVTGSHPWAVAEVFRLFAECRRRAGLAPDTLPMGLEANRHALETALGYMLQQQLLPRRFEVDELFDGVTRELGGSRHL